MVTEHFTCDTCVTLVTLILQKQARTIDAEQSHFGFGNLKLRKNSYRKIDD